MKSSKRTKLITSLLVIVGVVMFVAVGLQIQWTGPSRAQYCMDLGPSLPCELENGRYGIPFAYTEGTALTPHDLTLRTILPVGFFADAAIWIVPLPLIYLTIIRHRNKQVTVKKS